MITPEQYVPITNKHNLLCGLTYEEVLEKVSQEVHALQYVHQQTPELCMVAVSQNGYALQYVHQKTPEICMAAVSQDKDAIRHVNNQFYQQVATAFNL